MRRTQPTKHDTKQTKGPEQWLPNDAHDETTASISLESLEQKVLLAATNLLGSGELKITGTNGADNVEVRKVGDQIKVKVQGVGTTSYDATDVTSISFDGKNGHDKFHNKTNIPSTALGGAGKDTLIGGTADDVLKGGGAKDDLRGRSGNDELRGGGGGDIMKGHDGNDEMHGGGGHDKMLGGADQDTMFGNEGNDSMLGGTGNDGLRGNDGDDAMSGGKGNDFMLGDDGNDQIRGNDGNDLMGGGDGHDDMNGGRGTDSLYGGANNDVLNGGGFDNAADLLVGGTGYDTFHNYEKWGGGWEDTISDAEAWEPVHEHERLIVVIPEFEFIPFLPVFELPELEGPVLEVPPIELPELPPWL